MADQPQRWFADGLELTSGIGVRGIESYDGQFSSPTLLASDVSIPQRDGEMPGHARLSPGGFTLSMWMGGRTRSQIEADWEHLLRVLMKRHRLIRWERRRPDGTARECYGRVVGRIAPTPIGQLGMRAQIEVVIPSGTWQNTGGDADSGELTLQTNGPVIPLYWDDPKPGHKINEDQVPAKDPSGGALVAFYADGSADYSNGWKFHATRHTFSRTGALLSGAVDRLVELPGFQGASAPMTRLWVQVKGPVSGLVVECPETRSWARYEQQITATQALTIRGADDIVQAPRVDLFRYKGPYMVEMLPQDDPSDKPRLRVAATQADPTATIRVVGRRLYQTM